jgi:hypothetical protein
MYEQTFEIEHRLSDLLKLVEAGKYSTPRLAELLDVSIPTISRGIRALRGRGHLIRSKRLTDGSWCYCVESSESFPGLRGRRGKRGGVELQNSRVGT